MASSPTEVKRQDRRVERTQRALLEALMELIAKKGYEQTTVQDILDRANVGRATFYAHYFNKQDLLLRRMSLFRLDVDDGGARRMPDVTGLFEHVAAARDILEGLQDSEALEAAWAIAREDLTESFRKLFENRREGSVERAARPAFLAHFFAGALLNLLMWWREAGMPETPRAMNRWFAQIGERVLQAESCERGEQ